jgi:phosphomannomutase
MNTQIFRDYDIRGVVHVDYSVADVQLIGKAFGSFVQRQGGAKIIVGYDGRLTSPELKEGA